MKRLMTVLATSLLAAGCQFDAQVGNNSQPAAPTTPAQTVAPAPAKPAAKIAYYEYSMDGKIYVFASDASLNKFIADKSTANMVEKQNLGTKSSTTVYFENGKDLDALIATWTGDHKPKAK